MLLIAFVKNIIKCSYSNVIRLLTWVVLRQVNSLIVDVMFGHCFHEINLTTDTHVRKWRLAAGEKD